MHDIISLLLNPTSSTISWATFQMESTSSVEPKQVTAFFLGYSSSNLVSFIILSTVYDSMYSTEYLVYPQILVH